MPLGILSKEEFEKELALCEASPAEELEQKEPIKLGRPIGREEVPEEERAAIAELAIEGTPAKILQAEFGISQSSISAYKNGATSTKTYHDPDPALLNRIIHKKNRIADMGARRIIQALARVTPEKLDDASLKVVSSVAKDMSAVVRNIEGQQRNETPVSSGPTYIFYAPRIRKEQEFEVIDATKEE